MAYYDSGRSQGKIESKGKFRTSSDIEASKHSSSITFRGFPSSITRKDIREIFGKAGDILDVKINTFPYVGSGFVTYSNMEEVTNAVELLDYLNYEGNLIRVDYYECKPVKKTNGCRTVVMEGFNSTLTEKELKYLFRDYGVYVSLKLIISDSRRRCAVVEFKEEVAAERAIKKLDNTTIKGQLVTVSPCIPESVKEEEVRERRGRTVVVRNFSEKVGDLRCHFANIGYINDAEIEQNEDGSSKCGYVTFEKIHDAAKAITRMNGHLHDNKCWIVEWAQPEPCCIVVKNLQVSVFLSENYLYEMFAPFGWVKSCKVRVDSEDASGFVRFRKHEEAARAVRSMNGTEIAGKPLSVAFAESSKFETTE